ncbi:unnamed protein product, partial [Mesorhabditis spiculigera]
MSGRAICLVAPISWGREVPLGDFQRDETAAQSSPPTGPNFHGVFTIIWAPSFYDAAPWDAPIWTSFWNGDGPVVHYSVN